MVDDTPSCLRRRTKQRRLSLEDMIEAVGMVLIKKMLIKDVARHIRITTGPVSSLMSRVKKIPSLLRELINQREVAAAEKLKVIKYI